MDIVFILATGNTLTVTVKPAALQPPGTLGVTKYVAVWIVLFVCDKVPVIDEAVVPGAPPVIPPVTIGALQLYEIPEGIVPVNDTVNPTPEQVVSVTLLITAVGNTFTVTVNPAEVHPPATFGVTKYVAVCMLLVVFDKVPATDPDVVLSAPPVIPPVTVGALQLYVVPEGIVPVNAAVNPTPVQVLSVTLLIEATGNTLTVTVNPAEVQPPGTFGVTKYVAVCWVLVVLDNVPVTDPAVVPGAPPVMPPVTVGAFQL